MKCFPRAFSTLASLIDIELLCSKAAELPEPITQLPNLEILMVDWVIMATLPDSINNLQPLQELRINGYPVVAGSIEYWSGYLTELSNLGVLDLQYQRKLTQLPESLSNLQTLEKHFLNGTPVTLPDSISAMTALKFIDILGKFDILGKPAP